MQALRGGFRRFDDKALDEERKARNKPSRVNADMSALPILNFEDSNGVSPENSPNRWETFEPDEPPQQITTNQPLNFSSRVLQSIDQGFGNREPRNRRQSRGRFGDTESITQPSRPKNRKMGRRTNKNQAVAVFDPFCDDDYENFNQNTDLFNNQVQNVDPNSNWQAFTTAKEHFQDFNRFSVPLSDEFYDENNPFHNAIRQPIMSPSAPEQQHSEEFKTITDSRMASYYSEERIEAHTPSVLENYSLNYVTNEEEGGYGKDTQFSGTEFMDKGSTKASSDTSFPDRVKPIDFLKENQNIEQLRDSYSDEIFIKIDQSSHMRGFFMQKKTKKIDSHNSTEDDTAESHVMENRHVKIEAPDDPGIGGIEILDVDTFPSMKDEQDASPRTPSGREEVKIIVSNGENAVEVLIPTNKQLVNDASKETDNASKELHNSTRRFSRSLDTNSPANVGIEHNEINSAHEATKEVLPNFEKKQNEYTDALKKFVQLAAPVVSSGAISLAKDDPIRLAAEKLGISIQDSKYDADEPKEERIWVPLNVEIKPKSRNRVAHAQKLISEKYSIHFKTNQRKRFGTTMSPSIGSLLDSDTDISDLQCSSQSTSSSADPTKQAPTIDLQRTHSDSVSTLTFRGQQSEDSEDKPGDSIEKVRRRNEIAVDSRKGPQVPNRHKENDLTVKIKHSHGPRIESQTSQQSPTVEKKLAKGKCPNFEKDTTQKQSKSGPLGASWEEIKMINKFLALAGPDFDGPRLSIEERAQLYDKALKAGLGEDFINNMLDRSAGILLWEARSFSSEEYSERSDRIFKLSKKYALDTPQGSTMTGRSHSFRTRDTRDRDDLTKTTWASSYSEDFTYDEEGFTRKTPKEDTFSCLKNIFWMESSNIVGDDMTENILAVVSADSESLHSRQRQRNKPNK